MIVSHVRRWGEVLWHIAWLVHGRFELDRWKKRKLLTMEQDISCAYHRIDPSWWTYWANCCSTTGVTSSVCNDAFWLHCLLVTGNAVYTLLLVSERGRSSEVECSLKVRWVVGSILHGVDPLSYFSFQPVLHDWCNKGRGMCYPVCGMVHIKEPLLSIDKSSLCGGSGFPFSLSEWSLTICLTPYNRR